MLHTCCCWMEIGGASALSMNKQCLYLAVTNDTIGTPLPLSVGPGFSMPPTVGYGLPAFEPLSTESLILAEDPAALADALVRSLARPVAA